MSTSNAGTLRSPDAGRSDPLGQARARLSGAGPAAAGWLLPFSVVLVLGLDNGGYDVGARSEVGIAIWWILLIGAASGMIGFRRLGAVGWSAIGGLAVFGLWTGLGISWSESSERSVIELARVLTYLGVFALALAVQGREGLRRTLGATGAAIAVIGLVALLSRLHPSWFGDALSNPRDFAVARTRLNYPLNYWNGLAALMAIGVPLLLTMALRARSLLASALAAAAVPMIALTAYYTLSRGGAAEVGVALVVLVALYPRRLAAAPTLLLTGAGSAILIAAASQRGALEHGLTNAAADGQRDEMIALLLVVCAGVALVQVALGLARRHRVGPQLEVPRRTTLAATGLAGVVALVIALGAGLPGEIDNSWQEFKQPTFSGSLDASRFASASGSGRYQFWRAAIKANESSPWTGIGPGTFEFWWAGNGTIDGFVRDAHSLYLETLGELGIIGFILIVGLVGGVLVLGTSRALRAGEDDRALLAGCTAACAAFAAAAAIDWVWELAVIPCAFLLLAAAIAGPYLSRRRLRAGDAAAEGETTDEERERRLPLWRRTVPRIGIAASAAAAIVAIAIPYAATDAVSASQDQARGANFAGALADADSAANIQPYAASPSLQRALVLERSGDLAGAAAAARDATREESTNWRTWLVLSRIEAFRGNAQDSVDAYRRARSLNPRSALFGSAQ